MEDIKVEEYVRDEKGFIFVADERWLCDYETMSSLYDKEYKHSPNIIDLIEKDDYVNGQLVRNIDNGLVQGLAIQDDVHDWVLVEDIEIVSIVTREAFKNAEYRVETN